MLNHPHRVSHRWISKIIKGSRCKTKTRSNSNRNNKRKLRASRVYPNKKMKVCQTRPRKLWARWGHSSKMHSKSLKIPLLGLPRQLKVAIKILMQSRKKTRYKVRDKINRRNSHNHRDRCNSQLKSSPNNLFIRTPLRLRERNLIKCMTRKSLKRSFSIIHLFWFLPRRSCSSLKSARIYNMSLMMRTMMLISCRILIAKEPLTIQVLTLIRSKIIAMSCHLIRCLESTIKAKRL